MTDASTLALDKGDISLFQALDGVARPCLILYSGPDAGRRFDLECGRLLLGRGDDVDIPMDGRGVSRRHAELLVTPQGVQLCDLGSANCSWVNDKQVLEPVMLADGDLVRLANMVFRFHDRRSLDALLHDRLYRMATIDPGTSLFNRRYLQELLKLETARARRSGQPLALVCCDLDHFKSVNDSWGHAAGDLVLERCAALLRGELRAGDAIGRWGGEEFMVLACSTDLAAAGALAERLRRALAEHVVELDVCVDGVPTRIRHRQTLSLGVAALQPEMSGHEELLAAADRCLYAAKAAGRDRVVIAPF